MIFSVSQSAFYFLKKCFCSKSILYVRSIFSARFRRRILQCNCATFKVNNRICFQGHECDGVALIEIERMKNKSDILSAITHSLEQNFMISRTTKCKRLPRTKYKKTSKKNKNSLFSCSISLVRIVQQPFVAAYLRGLRVDIHTKHNILGLSRKY